MVDGEQLDRQRLLGIQEIRLALRIVGAATRDLARPVLDLNELQRGAFGDDEVRVFGCGSLGTFVGGDQPVRGGAGLHIQVSTVQAQLG